MPTGNADLQPTLTGTTLVLRPLQAGDFEELHAVASDPLIWEQHPEPTRCERAVFEKFFAKGLASGGALAVVDKASSRIIGSSRFYEWDAPNREIAIGYTFLARSYWGGAANREMKQMMLAHAFGFAGTVWFHVGKFNMRSRKAMEKIGGMLTHEGLRPHNGVDIEYVYYAIRAPLPRNTKAGKVLS